MPWYGGFPMIASARGQSSCSASPRRMPDRSTSGNTDSSRPELVHRELVPHPQRHAREVHRELVDLDPLQIREREVHGERLLRREAGVSAHVRRTAAQLSFDATQLPVRDVEEVPRSARRVEHDVVHQIVLCSRHVVERPARCDSLAPRLDDRRQNDLEDVRLRGVVRSERPLALTAERSLEQTAEDRRLDVAPVEIAGRTAEQVQLLRAPDARARACVNSDPFANGVPW